MVMTTGQCVLTTVGDMGGSVGNWDLYLCVSIVTETLFFFVLREVTLSLQGCIFKIKLH